MYNLFRLARSYNCRAYFNQCKPKTRFFSQETVPEVNTNVAKDVILFKYDDPRFFRLLNIFAGVQFVFWTYLAIFAYTSLKDVPPDKSEGAPWWKRINLGEKKYRNGIAIFSLTLGNGLLAIAWFYTLRSVRYLILRKGGKQISLVTYTPLGTNRILTVELKNINCRDTRTSAKSQIPIKVKGHILHYVLDVKGEFKNPVLFDHTAGLSRNWTSTMNK